ncbi:ParA family protein [Myxococcota bacterium]|nr:ParA family protein [Myxococcota bacterium]MBU1382295.1 ParA family protein [Myxococcota bacterium]MBU1496349.1 ParA family protein [Myxococcota bacterium]
MKNVNIISFISAKGGTGKTTSVLNTAVALAEMGKATLVIDMDPMGCIGFSLDRKDTEWEGLVDHFIKKVPASDVIVSTKIDKLHILPRGRLAPGDVVLYEELLHSSRILSNTIYQVIDKYDYILLDTPSGLGMITHAVLSTSTFGIAVIQSEPLCFRTTAQVLSFLGNVKDTTNRALHLLGILPTMVDRTSQSSVTVHNTMMHSLPGLFESFIPRNNVFAEASQFGIPVSFLPGKRTPEITRYSQLALEIDSRILELREEWVRDNSFPTKTLI